MDELTRRVTRAAESILEHESLTDGLDDAPAQALINWGVACAEMIAQGTAGLNDSEAEGVISLRLRATRRLMRLVNLWVANRMKVDAETNAASLARIIEKAAVIYGEDFTPPGDDQRDAFLEQYLGDHSLQLIENLRVLVEGSDNPTTNSEGN